MTSNENNQKKKKEFVNLVGVLFTKHKLLTSQRFVWPMDGWILFWQKVRKVADWRHCRCVILPHLSLFVKFTVHFTVYQYKIVVSRWLFGHANTRAIQQNYRTYLVRHDLHVLCRTAQQNRTLVVVVLWLLLELIANFILQRQAIWKREKPVRRGSIFVVLCTLLKRLVASV